MNQRKRPNQKRHGLDRFGYRPTPDARPATQLYPPIIGQTARQEMLDKIYFDRLADSWQEEKEQKGREQWTDLGNKELPIDNYKHDIMKMVASNRISLLQGETGSGKSTQLAQYALEMGYDHIVYLQPRRVTTDGISERIDEELTNQFEQKNIDKPEHLVSMAHSERANLHDDSIIQVMTSAVFAKRAPDLQDTWRDKKVLIVADEIHEGNIETEFAVAMSAEMMTEQQKWNMVLMSATMNEDEIQRAYASINGRPIPSIEVEGRPHEIASYEEPKKNVIDVFRDSCQDGNKTLIFTEGKRAIGAIEAKLRREFPEARILKLHSKITDEERREIFHKEVPGVHTVIISTSAGQSGLTIPGVDRVISDGMTKSPELDDESAEGLPSRHCTKAELTQQMGRGGRDIAGAKFFLTNQLPFKKGDKETNFDEFVPFDQRGEHAPADIYHTVITRNVLRAAAVDRDFYTLNSYLIHPVTHGTIQEAYQVLKMLGAVNRDNQCTHIGRHMDRFPLRPELSRALVAAMHTGTKEQQVQLAAIVAAVEAGGLGDGDPKKIEKNNEEMPSWVSDDFIAELVYFKELLRRDERDEQQADFVFDHVNAKRALKQYRKICRNLEIYDDADVLLDSTVSAQDIKELRNMLVKGMPHLLYEKVGSRRFRGRKKKMPDGTREERKPVVTYRNVLAPSKQEQPEYEFDRKVSNRSRLAQVAIRNTDLIAGYPRWYYDDNDKLHNVIERGFAIDKRMAEVALGDEALSVQRNAVVGADGRLRSTTSRRIGSLTTGHEVEKTAADTQEKVQQLYEAAIIRPGSAQRELWALKKELYAIVDRIPHEHRSYYLERKVPTQAEFEDMIKQAAAGSSSIGELDSELRNRMYADNLQFGAFITDQQYENIKKDMPDTLTIGDQVYDVSYQEAEEDWATVGSRGGKYPAVVPFITNFSLKDAQYLPDKLRIPDDREVLFRFQYGEGEERYLSAAEVKRLQERSV